MSVTNRHAYRQWWNGPEDKATARITWYHLADGSDIRLVAQDTHTTSDFYPASMEEAERIFEVFRLHAPRFGRTETHIVSRVLEYLKQNPFVPSPQEEPRNG